MTKTNRLAWPDPVVAVCLFLATLAAASWAAIDLFPMAEFRDWGFAGPLPADNLSFAIDQIWRGLTRQTAFSRGFALSYATAAIGMCEPDIRCANLPVLLPVALSASLLYLLGRRLGSSRGFALLAAGAWLMSAPVADALSWQATIFDRMALASTLGALLAYTRFTARTLSVGRLAGCNLTVGLLTILALGSKEIAFVLPAGLLLLALVEVGHGDRPSRRLLALLLPLGYSLFHILSYAGHYREVAPGWQAHVSSGDPLTNAIYFAGRALPFAQGPWALLAAGLGVVGLFVLPWLALERTGDAASRRTARAGCLLFLVGILATAAILRVQHRLAFYLYLPQAMYALGYGLLSSAVVRSVRLRFRPAAMIATAALPVLSYAGFIIVEAPAYLHFRTASANFLGSLARLRDALPPDAPSTSVVLEPSEIPVHLFTEGTYRKFTLYVDAAATRTEAPDHRLDWRFGKDCSEIPLERTCIRYDSWMRIVEVRRPAGG